MNYRNPFAAMTNRLLEPLPARQFLKLRANFIRIFISIAVLSVVALGLFYSPRTASSHAVKAPQRIDQLNPLRSSHKPSMLFQKTIAQNSKISTSFVTDHALRSTSMFAESVTTYAADCVTPKTAFTLGETVCAKTNDVDLNFPEPGRWVDWILTGSPNTIVSGSRTTTRITTNPQTFTYTPTQSGTFKVEITEDDGNGGDNPQTPAVFTVSLPPLSTYASDCLTPQTSFNLGQTICIKVSGLSSDVFPFRRVQVATPEGFVLQRFDVTDNSQQNSYLLPSAVSQTAGGTTINHVGNWVVALIDPNADLQERVPISVHKSNLVADWFADLQVSKLFIDTGDPPAAGRDITFQLTIFNTGPDNAVNPLLLDVTLPNTTFLSFTQQQFVASSVMPRGFDHELFKPGDYSYLRRPAVYGSDNETLPLFSFSASSLLFTCTPPEVGSPGTTTCRATGSLTPGQSATFTAVYRVDNNIANGTVLTDANSATVSSDTSDQVGTSNTQEVQLLTSNPNPPSCILTCPDNITVGTNALDAQNNRGAIVTFAPEAVGECGTGVTSTPASGSFFPVGTTAVTTQTGSGATCNFNVTVIDTPQPTITCAANQTAQASSGQTEVNVTVVQPTFAGSFAQNQDPPALSSSRSDRRPLTDPFPIGTTTITWVVTDQFGTQKSCNQLITVTSADAPTISCPSNKSFTATNGCSFTATSGQIGSPTTTGPNVTVTSERSDGLALTDPFSAGTTFIEWTATNAVGAATCTQTISVAGADSQAPTLTVPANITTSTSQCSVLLDDDQFVASADDDCGTVNISRTGIPQIACPTPGNPNRTCDSFVFPTGTTVITYTATDSAGNTSTGTQTVRVNESPNITPTIDAPADLTLNTGPNATTCGTFVGDATLGTATANDNCPGFLVTRTGVPAGNNFPVGTTTITYTVTDRVGNTAQDTQTVTVIDNTPPAISCPTSITLEPTCPTGAVATWTPPVGTDNCPNPVTTRTAGPAPGSVFQFGTTTVTYSVTDAHGNGPVSCSFTVTVLTSQAVIQNLLAAVQASSLNNNVKNNLTSRLNQALTAINANQQAQACQRLNEFTNSVQQQVNNGNLPAATGAAWINSANHVKNVVGCTSLPCS